MAQPEKFHICCGVGVQLSYFSRHMDWLSIRLPGGGLRNIWRLGKSHPPPTKTVKLTFVEVIRREFQIQLGSVMYSGVAFGQGFVKQIQLFWLPQDCLDCLSLFTRSERRTMGRHQSAKTFQIQRQLKTWQRNLTGIKTLSFSQRQREPLFLLFSMSNWPLNSFLWQHLLKPHSFS